MSEREEESNRSGNGECTVMGREKREREKELKRREDNIMVNKSLKESGESARVAMAKGE